MAEITAEQYNALRKEVEKLYRKIVEMSDNASLGILPGDMDDSAWKHTITEVVAGVTMDDISDGERYSKILSEAVQDSLPLLSKAVGDMDDILDGDVYGKVKVTAISAGKILLAEAIGNLDDIEDGSNYGKVALTSISAGKIVVAGLDSNVTDRMFTDGTAKSNIEAWRHTNDVTMIDGGKIYANSIVLANKASDFNWGSLGDDGHKPADDADVTGDNTAADTNAVGGLASSNIAAWAKTGAVTYIDGGKIYTGSITANQIAADAVTADKINVSSLSAVSATLGTVHSGNIYGTRFYVGENTNEDIYFSDSGIHMYDYNSIATGVGFKYGTSTMFYNLQYSSSTVAQTIQCGSYYINLGISSSSLVIPTLLTNRNEFGIVPGGEWFIFRGDGAIVLPDVSSNPASLGSTKGGICSVNGVLKFWNGSAWVNV